MRAVDPKKIQKQLKRGKGSSLGALMVVGGRTGCGLLCAEPGDTPPREHLRFLSRFPRQGAVPIVTQTHKGEVICPRHIAC